MQTPPPPGDEPTMPSGQHTPPHQPDVPPYPPRDVPPAHSYPQPQPYPYPGMYSPPPSYAPYPSHTPYGPPYAPPPQPPRSSNKGLWIGLSILGAVILLSCVACAVGFGFLINASTRAFTSSFGPELTATEFCTDEENSDYVAVYDLFSSNLQAQMAQNDFVAASQAREQANGIVRDCVAGVASQSQGGSMRVAITLTLNDGQHQGFLTLVQSSGIWQIDSYDQSLGLT